MQLKEILELVRDSTFTIDTAIKLMGPISSEDKLTIQNLLNKLQERVLPLDRILELIETIRQANLKLDNDKSKNESDIEGKSKTRQTSRPLELDEYHIVMKLCTEGFIYTGADRKNHKFFPKPHVALAFLLQTNLGLRISDVLKLKPSSFKDTKLEIIEKKTGKLQYRSINSNLKNIVMEYALENGIKKNEYLIPVKRRAIHAQIEILREYLQLDHISSHSFRKLFGTTVYAQTNDIDLLRELYNHSSITTTQKYIRVKQAEMNEVSASLDFTTGWSNKISNKDIIDMKEQEKGVKK